MNPRAGKTSAIIPYSDALPTFALPIISTDGSNDFFVQTIDEYTGRVTGLTKLDNDDALQIVPAYSLVRVKVGDPPILAFVDRDGNQHIGPVGAITAALKLNLGDQTPPYVKVQIAALIGDADDRAKARMATMMAINESSGQAAGRSYISSSLRLAFWNELEGAAKDQGASNSLRQLRASANAFYNQQGEPEIEVSDIPEELLDGISLDRIREKLFEEYNIQPSLELAEPISERLALNPQTLKELLNRNLGFDGRIKPSTYVITAGYLQRAGFKYIDEIAAAIRPYNSDMLSYIAVGNRQGQITRFEFMLIAALGEVAHRVLPYGAAWINSAISKFKEKRIEIGTYKL